MIDLTETKQLQIYTNGEAFPLNKLNFSPEKY